MAVEPRVRSNKQRNVACVCRHPTRNHLCNPAFRTGLGPLGGPVEVCRPSDTIRSVPVSMTRVVRVVQGSPWLQWLPDEGSYVQLRRGLFS
jgi:hypothetical protein